MKRFFMIMLIFVLSAAAGCVGSTPDRALHDVATALERKDSAAFLAKIDSGRFAAAYMNNLMQGNPALRALDELAGKLFGMGVGDMVNSVASVEAELTADFRRRVSSGELVNECSQASSPNCLWVPASLRSARIKELDADAATAQVTVPGNIAGWLALAKVDGEWKIIGLSSREDAAAVFAKAPAVVHPHKPAAPAPATKL